MLVAIFFLASLKGNRVSKLLAARGLNSYIDENYGNLNLDREDLIYDFKRGNTYVGEYKLLGSEDIFFSVYTDMLGRIKYDNYEDTMSSYWNTMKRLEREYDKDIDRIVRREMDWDIDMLGTSSLTDESLEKDRLKLDMKYNKDNIPFDIEFYVYLLDENLTLENVAKKTLELYRLIDKNNIRVLNYSVVLEMKNLDGEVEDSIGIYDFPKAKLTSNDLANDMKIFFENWNIEKD